MRGIRLATSVVAVLLAVVAAPAYGRLDAGALKNARLVQKDVFINGNGDNTAANTVDCPDGKRMLTGGAFPADALDFLGSGRVSDSAPTPDGRGWYADAASLDGSGLTFTVDVRCLAKQRLAAVEARSKRVHVPVNSSDGGFVKCPAGTRVLTGGAYWQPGHDGPDSTLANLVALWSSSPTHNGKRWFAAGYNGSASNLNLTLVARCIAKRKLAHVEPIAVGFGVSDGSGNGGADACPAGTRLLTGGAFWTDKFGGERPDPEIAPGVSLLWSSPTIDDRSLDAGFSNHAGSGEKFITKQLRCLGG